MSAVFSNLVGFSSEKDPKVVVIGAGIAGLTTAYRLHKKGVSVDLYEARNRVGGRIFTVYTEGRITELGGKSISDGGEAINLHRLIEEFDLQLAYKRVCLKNFYFNGKDLFSVNQLLQEQQFELEALKKKIDELALCSSNMKEILEKVVDKKAPLYKFLATSLAGYEGGSIEKLSPLYGNTLFHMLLGGICSAHQGSGKEGNYIDLISIEQGNAVLPQKIAESLDTRVHLNMSLTHVEKQEDGLFSLTFQNGEKIKADILVLAIPCSVYEQIVFANNVIPSQKLEAIQSIQYGENAKIMVPFKAFPANINGVCGEGIASFTDPLQNILTVYYSGKTSVFSEETIASVYKQARPMIEKGFGEDCPPFMMPQYVEDQNFTCYEGPVGWSWPNDPYARGTYSYIASGQEELLTATLKENKTTFKALFAPIQKLYFAGEHASILSDVPGTMEAACESGERTALAILKMLKLGI